MITMMNAPESCKGRIKSGRGVMGRGRKTQRERVWRTDCGEVDISRKRVSERMGGGELESRAATR